VPALHWLVQFLVIDKECGPRLIGVLAFTPALARSLVFWQGVIFFFIFS
jgi:hypothetical protein